jgi:hypothetical protein
MLTGTATQTATASALCILDHSSSLLFQRFSVTLNGAAVSSIIWDCVERRDMAVTEHLASDSACLILGERPRN